MNPYIQVRVYRGESFSEHPHPMRDALKLSKEQSELLSDGKTIEVYALIPRFVVDPEEYIGVLAQGLKGETYFKIAENKKIGDCNFARVLLREDFEPEEGDEIASSSHASYRERCDLWTDSEKRCATSEKMSVSSRLRHRGGIGPGGHNVYISNEAHSAARNGSAKSKTLETIGAFVSKAILAYTETEREKGKGSSAK